MSHPVYKAGGQGVRGRISLPAMFSDHMVLQRNSRIPFWGTAEPGEEITVSLPGQHVPVTADSKGRWIIYLAPVKAGGPLEVTISGKNKDPIELKDVFIGDVWIASGQSNMEMTLGPGRFFGGVANHGLEIAASADPLLRVFTVEKNSSVDTPQTQVSGQWLLSNPQNAGGFTAVGYFFARELRKELGIPIGIISTSWGASPAQAWTSRETLMADPELRPIMENWEKIAETFKGKLARYYADSSSWQQEADKAKVQGRVVPANKPVPPPSPVVPQKRPSSLYNGMIAPLIPYAMKGVIWYQGEGNTDNPEQYQKLFPAMIGNWRNEWGEGNFPFLFVQLANFMKVQEQPSEGGWAGLREAQRLTLALPNTGMAVAIDIGEEKEIHARNKREVGHRLALCALSQVYKRRVRYSGPVYETMQIKGPVIRLYFKYTEGGLKIKEGKELKGFAVAGRDRNFVWAHAKIRGRTIIISSPRVTSPSAVRYSWANNPIGNLYNGSDLPASPFRTDTWQ
jgi:sialate O-acetylesterase